MITLCLKMFIEKVAIRQVTTHILVQAKNHDLLPKQAG